MDTAVAGSNASSCLDETDTKNLKALLEAFGSMVSLEDMASAYCESGRDLQATAERLCSMNPNSGSFLSVKEQKPRQQSGESEWQHSRRPAKSKWKTNTSSVSMGTVSGFIGKDYLKVKPNSVELAGNTETVKLSSDDIPASEIWDEKNESLAEPLESNVEEFIFKMLGDGFHLEKGVIQEVIGQCGYNISTSIDKLLDLSAGTLEKNDDLTGSVSRNPVISSNNSCNKESLFPKPGQPCSDILESSEKVEQSEGEIRRKNIQAEILETLFTVPERVDEKKGQPPRKNRRANFGEIVSKPLEDEKIIDFTFITRSPVKVKDHEGNENNYEYLRQAVKEYWSLMKDYLKAGAEAFTKEEYDKAKELMEMGAFYMRKAREADEKSAQELIDDRDKVEDFCVNMHYLEPKVALDHMKLLLTNFAGVPYIRNLKLVTGTDTGNKKDKQRKRSIMNLLEKEGIKWTTEGNDWTIVIDLENVDHKKVSFDNK